MNDYERKVLEAALDRYVEWLNMWMEANDFSNDFRYTKEVFLVNDPDRRLYGDSRLIGRIPMGPLDSTGIFQFSVYDGDDGGPAELTVWADEIAKIHHIVQSFDTYVQSIYDATASQGTFLSKPLED